LFAKDKSTVEVYNDLNDWLVNLYKVIRNNPEELIRHLDLTHSSRSIYKEACELYQRSQREEVMLDPVEKAVLFYVLIKQAFNNVPGNTWSYSPTSSKGSAWRTNIDLIMPAHRRLKEVVIECLPYDDLIPRYDDPDTLFYFDPPYVHITRVVDNAYEYELSEQQHVDFCFNVLELEGMVVISGYNSDIYDQILCNDNGWESKEIEVSCHSSYIPGVDTKPRRTEVLWWNPQVSAKTSQLVLL
jgi:DNA adenine methylase